MKENPASNLKYCSKCQSTYPAQMTDCPTDGTILKIIARARYLDQTILDHYKITKLLGAGEWSEVYEAFDSKLKRFVAVKTLYCHQSWNSASIKRFQNEARALARLRHRNVVTVYDHGFLQDGTPYLVMQLIKGKTLSTMLDENDTLSWGKAFPILQAVAQGLSAAHAIDLTHRDIKPDNILIPDDEQEEAKIVDFGLAHCNQEAMYQYLTKTGEVIGTPWYMSPEQCKGKKADARSDIYSFGCVMFETLTGTPPFTAPTAFDSMLKQINEPPPTLNTKARQTLPHDLDKITKKCLEKDPELRYSSFNKLLEDLRKVKAGKPLNDKNTITTDGVNRESNHLDDTRQSTWKTLFGICAISSVFIAITFAVLNSTGLFSNGTAYETLKAFSSKLDPATKEPIYNPVRPPGLADLNCGQAVKIVPFAPLLYTYRQVDETRTEEQYHTYNYSGKFNLNNEEVPFAALEIINEQGILDKSSISYRKEIAANFSDLNGKTRFFEHIQSVELEHQIDGFLRSIINCKNGDWVFLVKENGIVSACTELKPGEIYRGFRLIRNSNENAFIDKSGKIKFKIEHRQCRNFSEGLAAVSDGNHWGYLDTEGKLIIKPTFQQAGDFHDGLAWVTCDGSKYGYIDKTGKMVIAPNYTKTTDFYVGLAQVQREGKLSYLDKYGHSFPEEKHWLEELERTRLAQSVCPLPLNHKKKYDYVNALGQFVTNESFDYAERFHGPLALVGKDDNWSYINRSGQLIVPFKHTQAFTMKDGMCRVSKHNKWTYINDQGLYIGVPPIEHCNDFSDGLAAIEWHRRSNYITRKGRAVLRSSYFVAGNFSEELAPICKYGLWGYINKEGQLLIAHSFVDAAPFSCGLAKVTLLKDSINVRFAPLMKDNSQYAF